MAYSLRTKVTTKKLFQRNASLFSLPRREKYYLYLLLGLSIICAFVYPHKEVAMWVAFFLAGYSAIANDSIQTIGTFISANSKRVKWYYLWLFIGLIFLITITYSWIIYDGDISYQRLQNKGLDQAPTSFTYLQLISPLILLMLTRMRMPVSTSILLLSAFSTQASTLGKIVAKSFFGYLIAFCIAFVLWNVTTYALKRYFPKRKRPATWWYPLQWITSGGLWSIWIMQDMANFAVVLPRSLSLLELMVVGGYIFIGLGIIFYLKGDKIQQIVQEKTNVSDVRVATIIDLTYALILYYLKGFSTIPISTTWVFIGLLGGRELGLSFDLRRGGIRKKRFRYGVRLIAKDILYAGIGLLISLVLAMGVNEEMRSKVLSLFP